MADVWGRISCLYDAGETTEILHRVAGFDETAADAPFVFPGSVQRLGQQGRLFLASGTKGLLGGGAPCGVIAVIAAHPDEPVDVVESREYGGRDIIRSCWAPDVAKIICLDGADNTLYAAPWGGPGQSLPGVQDFAPIIDSQQAPVLSERFVTSRELPDGIRVTNSIGSGVEVRYVAGQWVSSPHASIPDEPPGAQEWVVESPRQVDAGGPVRIELAGAPRPYTVVTEVNNQRVMVASGVHPGGGGLDVPVALMPQIPGRPFYLLDESDDAVVFRPVLIRGQAFDSPGLDIVGDVFLPTEAFFVGVKNFFAPRM